MIDYEPIDGKPRKVFTVQDIIYAGKMGLRKGILIGLILGLCAAIMI